MRTAAEASLNAHSDTSANILFIATVDALMHLACSSVFYGGGTNQELAHHCLYQCKGDIMVSSICLIIIRHLWIPGSPDALLEISGPSDQRWSAVVKVTAYGGVSKRPHSCSSSSLCFRMHRRPLLQRIHTFVRSAVSRKAAPDT